MNKFSGTWNFMRILRLVIGVIIIIQAILEKEAILGLLGSVVLLTALTNTGCGAGNCTVPRKQNEGRRHEL